MWLLLKIIDEGLVDHLNAFGEHRWTKEVIEPINPNFLESWKDYKDSFPKAEPPSLELCAKILTLSRLTATPLTYSFFAMIGYEEDQELLKLAPAMQFLSTNFLATPTSSSIVREAKPYLERCLRLNPRLLACILAYATELKIEEKELEDYLWLIRIFADNPQQTAEMFNWLWEHRLYAAHHEYLKLLVALAKLDLEETKTNELYDRILFPEESEANYYLDLEPFNIVRLSFPRVARLIQPKEKSQLGLAPVGTDLNELLATWNIARKQGKTQTEFIDMMMQQRRFVDMPLGYVFYDSLAHYGIDFRGLNLKGLIEKTRNDESFPLIWHAVRQEIDQGNLNSQQGVGKILKETVTHESNRRIASYYEDLVRTQQMV